jgi:hypothetical protein
VGDRQEGGKEAEHTSSMEQARCRI